MDNTHPFSPQTPYYVSDQSETLPSFSSPQNSSLQQHNHVMGGVDDGSENDGFVSGEEDFPDGKSTEGDVVHNDTPLLNSTDFFTPLPERPRPMANPSFDGADDGVSEGGVFGATKPERGGDGNFTNLDLDGEGSGENLGPGVAGWEEEKEDYEAVKESGFGDSHEEFVEASAVAAAGDDDDKGSETESGKLDGINAEENGVKLYDLKDGEVVVEKNNGFSYDEQHAILTEAEEGGGGGEVGTGGYTLTCETDHYDSLIVDKSVENGDVHYTGAGDSLVDTLQVNLLASGVAVVGDKEDVEESGSEIKGVEGPARGVSLDNGFDPIDKLANGDAKSDQNVDTLEKGQESDIDILEKDEILEVASHILKDVQDDIKIEAHAEEGDNESYVEAHAEEGDNGSYVEAYADEADNGSYVEAHADEGDNGSYVEPHADEGDNGSYVEAHADEGDNGSYVEAHAEGGDNGSYVEAHADEEETGCHVEASRDSLTSEYVNPNSSWRLAMRPDEDDEEVHHPGDREIDGSVSDGEGEEMIFGSSEAAKRFLEELEQQSGIGSHSGADSSRDPAQRIDGQIVTDSEEEVDTDDEGDGKELFDSTALAALLKAATGAGQDGGGITITSQDGSKLFSVERPAGLGSSLRSGKPATGSNHANLFPPSISRAGTNSDLNLSEEEKKKLEKLQQIRIKFLRLVQRLGFTLEESIAAQVLYRLTLVAGRQTGQIFSLDAAKGSASQLEAEGREDLDCSLNILVLGKTGVGKSASINSIFGEMKTSIGAYGPATTAVTEIVGMVDGVKIRIFDTPGLKSSALEQSFNRKVLSMVKKLTKKSPPDIVLYVDRLDTQTRDLNDLPLLRSITDALGPSIWRNAVLVLTHAASAPPDGPSGSPLSYDVFVAQRSHIVQQTIGQAVGDLRLMNPSLMNPVSLVENHPSCRKNRDGQKVLPNGQSWRPLLLLLCYSMKILSEAGNLSKTQESVDHRRLFGFRVRSPPLPYLLSWLLQSRTHPKLPADQGGVDNGDSDIELADLSDSDLDEDEDEYDQLLPFKPLKKSQVAKLSGEQRKAYFEEYDYRVKLLQKKQWREELRRMREMKKKGKTDVNDYGYLEEDDQENGSPAAVPVPLPDMALPPSFDSDNPAYRYRFLEPTSQFLTRPVLDTHSWDHDCGYDGVNLEHSLAIINKFPAAVAVQISKDKKDFSIHLDSSISAKHGENGSTMAGFDIQNIGKQLAYILRGETKFKNFKRNKTAAGLSVTFLGENVSTGLKVEDQIALGKRLVLVGSTGIVRSQGDSAYGTNVEVRLREADFPIGQDQSSLGLSLVKWRGDLALGANFQSQFSIGRSYKLAVRAGLNNKQSGQITVRTSSSDQLQIALLAILPIARAIYKNFWPKASENYSIY